MNREKRMIIQTVNPATEEVIKDYEELSDAVVSDCINHMHDTYYNWSKTSFNERKSLMLKAAEILKANQMQYATLMTNEMGKLISESLAEIDKCVLVCEHYAEHAESYLTDKVILTAATKSYVSYQPLGVVFAIMPWNYPFWQVFRFACPTLMAGNAGLLSHASISSGVGQAIEDIFIKAGFPKNIFKSVIISNKSAEKVIENKKIIAVTLTGSDKAGRAVGKTAGANLKKVVLELGGSDPYIICDDADLDLAASEIIKSRMNNCGQVCIAAKRIICVSSVLSDLTHKIIKGLKKYQMGNPLDLNCNFGPLSKKIQRDEVHQQVVKSISQGAELLLGGQLPERIGFYYPPTLLANVKPGIEAFDNEVFGPVIALVEACDLEYAVVLANQSEYGLAGAIFTKNITLGEQIAREQLQVGSCAVNSMVKSDPKLPFGGIKSSGYGRELAEDGIKAFVNIKTITV